jgi:tetratricopeptide (TPR) repeat protein
MIRIAGWFLLLACALSFRAHNRAAQPDELERALAELSHLNFEQAYRHFSRAARDAAPRSQAWQTAVFGQATCAQHMTPPSAARAREAAELYRQLLAEAPDRFAPRAVLNLGRMAELRDYPGDSADLPAARRFYQEVIDRWPDDPIASEATLRLAAAYIQTYKGEDVHRGIAILQVWLSNHPSDPLAAGMWGYLGDTYLEPLKDYRRSIDSYLQADRLGFVDRTRQGVVYWRIAVMSDRFTDDRARAIEYYTKIVTDAPDSGKAYEAQLALKRLGAPVPPMRIDTAGGAP